jgi:hypothetical protein
MFHKYGKESLGGSERSRYTIKGRSVEDESIMLLSRIDGCEYKKNDKRYTNEYLTGEPDIIVRNESDEIAEIIDIKIVLGWCQPAFEHRIAAKSPIFVPVQGYMALTGAKSARVAYILVNMPQEIIEGEKKRIFYTMNPATEESVPYKKAISRLENNMTFDEIPISERRIQFFVQRDEELIGKIYKRIEECRNWLTEFEKIHLSLG